MRPLPPAIFSRGLGLHLHRNRLSQPPRPSRLSAGSSSTRTSSDRGPTPLRCSSCPGGAPPSIPRSCRLSSAVLACAAARRGARPCPKLGACGPQRPAGQVRRPNPGQDQEPGVVGQQAQALRALLGAPANESIARLTLQRSLTFGVAWIYREAGKPGTKTASTSSGCSSRARERIFPRARQRRRDVDE